MAGVPWNDGLAGYQMKARRNSEGDDMKKANALRDAVQAAKDFKYWLDIQAPGTAFHPGGTDARATDAYAQAAKLLDAAEATDTEGPRGSYGCACAHHDGSMCAWIRYGCDGPEDPCECLCHGWPEDEDDYLG